MILNYLRTHAGSASSSDEESQGSGGEHEAHHRTVRGREAQQIVQRLKSSYLNRSMSAPNAAAISPAGAESPHGIRLALVTHDDLILQPGSSKHLPHSESCRPNQPFKSAGLGRPGPMGMYGLILMVPALS